MFNYILIEDTDKSKDYICPLCEGSHGNNTMCQMSWEDRSEVL